MHEALAAEKRALYERRTSVRLAGVRESVKTFQTLLIETWMKRDDPMAQGNGIQQEETSWSVDDLDGHRFYLNDPELTLHHFINFFHAIRSGTPHGSTGENGGAEVGGRWHRNMLVSASHWSCSVRCTWWLQHRDVPADAANNLHASAPSAHVA